MKRRPPFLPLLLAAVALGPAGAAWPQPDDAAARGAAGTIAPGPPPGRTIAPAPPGEFEARILATAQALGVRAGPGELDALLAHLSSLQRRLLGPGTLPAVAQALERPLALDSVEAGIAAQVRTLAQPRPLQESLAAIHLFLIGTLDVPDVALQPDTAGRLSAARRHHAQRIADLLKAVRDEESPPASELKAHLELLRAGPTLVPLAVAMLPAAARQAADLEQFAHEVMAAPQSLPAELEARVRAAAGGPVLGARLVDGALWVVGGDGSNRYDMSRIAAVFDAGGADEYLFPAPGQAPIQLIIDQSGDDRYESGADFAGPAAAFFSVSLLIDRAGNDRYLSYHQGSIAAGIFGVAILIDEAGDDRYVNTTAAAGWSQGAGVFGAGLLVDRGGNDDYQGQKLAQGVGGPSGLGLVCDASGNDTYDANGPHFASVYGDPQVFAGMSQGFGYGIRGVAPGGIGALYDFAGDDRYTVGEFGQGSGYFQGLGILHDAAGQDWYTASRYAQGAAAHQAAGILVDHGGDDWYLGRGSACQAGAWDQGVAMLVDRAGSDSYTGYRLAQGAAAHQAIAILVDADGEDRYACEPPCLGDSGDNGYHHGTAQAFSFSIMIDLGGTDHYARPRADDELLRTGTVILDAAATSECCGIFSDE